MATHFDIHSAKSRIEGVLTELIESTAIADAHLKESMQYSLLLGGKRIRPFLVYSAGEMLGADQQDLDTIAAAIESIHTYSLIHDDLPAMDDDDLRRGKATCHKVYGEATAILAGDTLQSFAFELLTQKPFKKVHAEAQLKIVATIAAAASQMCAGQSIDLQNGAQKDKGLEHLAQMHKLKTGALIKASVLSGALAANASAQTLDALEQYADAIGLAFQVWDDVLDITSDSETLGKPQGSDLEANKATYPALLGLEQAKQKAKELIDIAQSSLAKIDANTQSLSQLAAYIIERDH